MSAIVRHPKQPSATAGKAWRWTLCMVGTVAMLVLAGGLKLGWDYDRVAHELPKAVRDYRAAGLPWTAAELAPLRLSAAENAADPLNGAIVAWPSYFQSVMRPPQAVAQGGWAPYEPSLRLASAAAKRKELELGHDWDMGQAMASPEPSGVRVLIRTLTLRALGYARQGDDLRALTDLRDARRLAALIGQDPTLLSAFASAQGEVTVMWASRECLSVAASSPQRISLYRSLVAEPPRLPDLRRAMRSMAYLAVATGRNLSRTGLGRGVTPGFEGFAQAMERRVGVVPPPLLHDGLPESARQRAYLVRALKRWTELANRTHGLTDPIEKIEDEAWKIAKRPIPALGMSHNLDAILFPTFSGLSNTNRAPQVSRALVLAEADALLLYARTGGWPTTTTVTDPRGSGPLRLRVEVEGLRIWSVGPNRRDDAGLSWSDARKVGRYSDDEVVTIPRPGNRRQRSAR